jgi:acetyl-CoA decarbonylase/synthase complex subunit gamma
LKLGEETVLYRHEKTFVNQILFAVNINDTDNPDEIEKTLKSCKDFVLERVGEKLSIGMVAVSQKSKDPEKFAEIVKKAWNTTHKPIIIRSSNISSIKLAAEAVKGSHSIIASATSENTDVLKEIALQNEHSLAVTAANLDGIIATTEKLKKEGFNNLLLEFQTHSLAEHFQVNAIARRMAIKVNFKPLGYPVLRFIEAGNGLEDFLPILTEVCKYGGICVLPSFDLAEILPMMTLRQNIYTDPQKPIQVEPMAYPVGEPKEDSPVFLTTNFSLTYFIVSSEIENSGISAWLVVPQCEGMSVLTAWAAGKFSGAYVAKAIKEMELENKVTTRQIVIPGYVSQISGELEENLPGWKVIIGPQEAADIESFVKVKFK